MSIKVFVVEDSAIVRQALAHMLSANPEVELIGFWTLKCPAWMV